MVKPQNHVSFSFFSCFSRRKRGKKENETMFQFCWDLFINTLNQGVYVQIQHFLCSLLALRGLTQEGEDANLSAS
jgi:hypothetical protein